MMCPVCTSKNIIPIQESKEDYWLCKCGDYHKGYPYECPRREISNKIIKLWRESSSYKDFKDSIFYEFEIREIFKMKNKGGEV